MLKRVVLTNFEYDVSEVGSLQLLLPKHLERLELVRLCPIDHCGFFKLATN